MSVVKRIALNSKAFVVDYCQRHAHPLNAALHVAGVPMVFYGVFKLIAGRTAVGSSLFVAGYLLQYLGHKAQGNEVGEVTLIKSIWGKIGHRLTAGSNKNDEKGGDTIG
jgi:hypothetical protein